MKHSIKELKNSELEISVELSKEYLAKFAEQALKELGKEIKVKGFRPGHVPTEILKKQIGEEAIKYKTQDKALQKSYTEIVINEKLQVISRPKIKIEDEKEALKYTATVAIYPKVEVKDYKSIKVKKPEVKVPKKEIDEAIEDMKKYITTYKEVDRAAKNGDKIEIDFEGFDKDGKTIAGTKSSKHPMVLGDKTFIPGFEEELIGMKKDEEKEFDITFPKDYHQKDFQSKKVKFKVKVQKLEEAEIPKLNEELVEKLTGKKDSVENFKKEIEENLKIRKEREAKQKQENEYLEELLKRTKIELPEVLITEELHYIIQEVKSDIERKGMKFEQFIEQSKTTIEKLKEKYRPEAEKRVKLRIALQHIIKEEGIEPDPKEFEKELKAMKTAHPKSNENELKAVTQNRLALRDFFKKVLGE